MADMDDIQAQIDALKEIVAARKGGRPKKSVAVVEDNEVLYEEAPARRAPRPAPPKKAPAPKTGVELRPARTEARVPVRATVPVHRCNCPDCPHKS